MKGPLWQVLPTKMAHLARAGFLKEEQRAERAIYELLDEFDAKLTAIFARYAQGTDGIIPASARAKVELEIRNTSIWFASELETLIRNGAEVAAEQGIEAERKSQLLYVKKALEELPEEDGKRVRGLITELQKGAGGRK